MMEPAKVQGPSLAHAGERKHGDKNNPPKRSVKKAVTQPRGLLSMYLL